MRLRQLPGVALLGLLAALLAHTVSYGSSHAAGGPFHLALELLALTGGGGFALLAAVLAWQGARRHTNGSILAAALRPLIPGLPAMLASAGLWFVGIESVERLRAWDAPLPVILVCLIFASILLIVAARAVVRAVAAIAFAIAIQPFLRRPDYHRRRFARHSSARRGVFAYRRFARPPPGVMLPT
jgi:hypothetical protein